MPNPPRVLTSTEEIPGHKTTLRAFVARPEGMKLRPAVMVFHEWWGLNDQIKRVTERLAGEGYVAIAPGFYSRQGHAVTEDPAEAAKLAQTLQSQDVLKDINAVTRYLTGLRIVDPRNIGAVGFSLGGTFAIMTASHNSDVKIDVAFQGQVPPTDSMKYLVAPVLYLHGNKDTWVPKSEAVRLEQALAQFGRPGQVVHYPEAGLGFFNETRPEHRPADAQDAWDRTLAFLATHLGLGLAAMMARR